MKQNLRADVGKVNCHENGRDVPSSGVQSLDDILTCSAVVLKDSLKHGEHFGPSLEDGRHGICSIFLKHVLQHVATELAKTEQKRIIKENILSSL